MKLEKIVKKNILSFSEHLNLQPVLGVKNLRRHVIYSRICGYERNKIFEHKFRKSNRSAMASKSFS